MERAATSPKFTSDVPMPPFEGPHEPYVLDPVSRDDLTRPSSIRTGTRRASAGEVQPPRADWCPNASLRPLAELGDGQTGLWVFSSVIRALSRLAGRMNG